MNKDNVSVSSCELMKNSLHVEDEPYAEVGSGWSNDYAPPIHRHYCKPNTDLTTKVVLGPPIPGQSHNIYIVNEANRYIFYHKNVLEEKQMLDILNEFDVKKECFEHHIIIVQKTDRIIDCMGENKDLFLGIILEAVRIHFENKEFYEELCKIILRTMSVTCYATFDKKREKPQFKRAYEHVLTQKNNRIYFDVEKTKQFVLKTFAGSPMFDIAKRFSECTFYKPYVLRAVCYSEKITETTKHIEEDDVEYENENTVIVVYKKQAMKISKKKKKCKPMLCDNIEFATTVGTYVYGVTYDDVVVSNNPLFEPVGECEFFSVYENQFAYVVGSKMHVVRSVVKENKTHAVETQTFMIGDNYEEFEYRGCCGNNFFYAVDGVNKHCKLRCFCDEEKSACVKCTFKMPHVLKRTASVKDNVLFYSHKGTLKSICLDNNEDASRCKRCDTVCLDHVCKRCMTEHRAEPSSIYISPNIHSAVDTLKVGDCVYYTPDAAKGGILQAGVIRETKIVNCAKYVTVADADDGKESYMFPEQIVQPCRQKHLTVVVYGLCVINVKNKGYDRLTRTYMVEFEADGINIGFTVPEAHVLQSNSTTFFKACKKVDNSIHKPYHYIRLQILRTIQALKDVMQKIKPLEMFEQEEKMTSCTAVRDLQRAFVDVDSFKRQQRELGMERCRVRKMFFELLRREKNESGHVVNRPPVGHVQEPKLEKKKIKLARALIQSNRPRRKRRRRN